MGTRLRRLKAQLKGQILSDGKCLSGKNRLTEHEIDNLQSYYGSAIRRNHSSVQNMRQAIWAIFLHKLSTDEYPQHGFCPIGEDSWCGFKRLKHQIETLSLGVYDAVCSFNAGNVSKLKMLQKMGVEPGEFSVSAMKLLDRERLMKAIYAFSGRSKKIRKDKRRKERKKKIILRKIRPYRLPLTFNSPKLPSTIKAGYRNCKIRSYIPNPLRCFKYQRFGRSQTACRGQLTCSRCAYVGHASSDCSLEQKCVNCSQPHSADSKLYSKWKIEKEIQTVKTNRNISYIEANIGYWLQYIFNKNDSQAV
ncbi:uncharacterized protein TNCV_3237681 [Trichonephila clavipes]|nr:uncharacterized protein TNCV_3237681 [Trichonephila clavipes]